MFLTGEVNYYGIRQCCLIDDSSDFSEFSKEDVISSLIEETSEEAVTDQPIAHPATTELVPVNLLQ